jgi:hypothetical protein
MELGDGSYSSVPPGGGSGFLPYGFGADQHWYIMKQTYEQSVQVGAPVWFDRTTLYGIAAAGTVMHNPYSHLNLGDHIGALHVQSCDDALGVVPVLSEITRVLDDPSNACNSSDTGAGAALAARHIVRFRSCWTCAITAAEGPNAKMATTSIAVPVQFIDRMNRARLALYTSGPWRGRFTLVLKRGATFFGLLPSRELRGHKTRIAATSALTPGSGGRVTRARFEGELNANNHSATLHIRLGRSRSVVTLQTSHPNTTRAKATVRKVVKDLAANDLLGLVRLFTPAVLNGRSPTAVAAELAAQHVHITRVSTVERGKIVWLSEGDPGWIQPVTIAAAKARRPLHANLILQEEHGRWWLIGSS